MSPAVENLVSRVHAQRSGKGWLARCPAHDDRNPSLSIDEGADGRALIKCHAGCDNTAILASLGMKSRDLFPVTSRRQSDNGAIPTAPFEWSKCVAAFTDKHIERLAKWRGYSIDSCSWLKQNRLVGLHDNCIAFPVHDRAGKVVAVHYRLKDGSWRYYPQGAKVRPLVIGELIAGEPVHVFESQWDCFAFLDVSGDRTGVVVTRGASNGALVADLISENSTVYVWTQNDAAGEKWERDICANTKATVKRAEIPAPHKDLNDWTRAGASTDELVAAMTSAEVVAKAETPRPLIEFKTPSQLKNFIPPPGIVLVGDCQIVRGLVFVIGGAPGVGKSRGAVALAEAGATGKGWFGLTVHRRFKTMIIQAENGLFRLSKEFAELDCDRLEAFVRVSPPPQFGICFEREDFCTQLSAAIQEFQPDVIIFDPWNAAARDEKAREYLETFELIRSVLPIGDEAPAIGIVAHTRKPRPDERATGRALLNLLAGSYVLGSVPRTVFVMQAASDETEDNRIVWTCCKNNDGDLGGRSAWERRNGLFAPVPDFDWDTFDNPRSDDRVTITADDIAEVFDNGQKQLTRADAAKALQALTGAGRTACYTALKANGRFAGHLGETDGLLSWKP
jgi:hypothetical protein